jgi:hypothetical protein
LMLEFKTDYSDATISQAWKLRDNRLLGIGAYNTAAVIQQAEVVEISGKGKLLRAEK